MLQWIREKLSTSSGSERVEDHPSVVILLREPQWLTEDVAVERARRAWGATTELMSALNRGASFVFRNGKFVFAVHQAAQRYELSGKRAEVNEPSQRAWDDHRAWMSIDFPQTTSAHMRQIDSLGPCYKMLLIYAFLCWSPNCLAVYFPAEEGKTVPNLGDLAESIKWAGKNGIDLSFLRDK